jgi:type III pantothenate kinase
MILELDCGNSSIKWRVLRSDASGVLFAGAVSGCEQLLEVLLGLPGLSLQRCRLVSVRSDIATCELVDRLEQSFAIGCVVAKSLATLAGVSNGYYEPSKLGVDRWLAVLAAYNLGAGACLVIDVGTAVTADFVTSQGLHLGGYICPGLRLMSAQLASNAHGIHGLHSVLGALGEFVPGRSTDEAVGRGSVLMLRGFVGAQLEMASRLLGGSFQVFLTGGDAALVGALSVEARIVPDLVFVGLAIACP